MDLPGESVMRAVALILVAVSLSWSLAIWLGRVLRRARHRQFPDLEEEDGTRMISSRRVVQLIRDDERRRRDGRG